MRKLRAYLRRWLQPLPGDAEIPQILFLAAVFGAITGFGQALVWLIRKELLGQIINKGVDYGWMIPLANLVLLVLLGLVLELLHRRWPRPLSTSTAAFLLAWPAVSGLLLLVRRVSAWALILLAAGIAVQLARLVTKPGRRLSAAVRRVLAWPARLRGRKGDNPPPSGGIQAPVESLAGSVGPSRRQFVLGTAAGLAAVAFGTRAGLLVNEQRALARAGKAPPDLPNVLLIVLDTVRAQSLSLYGYSRPTTPNLQQLAAQGTLFTCAIAPSPWTLPSHASMFTGRYPHEYSYGFDKPVVTSHPFLAEVLLRAGYATAGFAANTDYCTGEYGITRGFAHYEDYRVTPGQAFVYTSFGDQARANLELIERLGTYRNFGRKSAEQVNADFLNWVSRQARRPFFAFLNYYDAHAPYLPPPSFGLRFSDHVPRGFTTAELARDLTSAGLRELQDAYDGSIAYLDQQVAALLGSLEARNLAKNTVVIITSDHGEQFGEHGLLSHGNSLYRYLLEVPLLFLWPGQIPAGMTVNAPVSLSDLPATVFDLTGVTPEPDMTGDSLADHWRSTQARPRLTIYSEVDMWWDTLEVPSVHGRHKSLISADYHYIWRPDGVEELYELEADPQELADLSGTPVGRETCQALRALFP